MAIRLRPGGDEDQGGQDGSTSCFDGFGGQTRADVLGFAAAAQWSKMGLADASPCAAPVRITEHMRKSGVSARTDTCVCVGHESLHRKGRILDLGRPRAIQVG
jgi:hypothetical protein